MAPLGVPFFREGRVDRQKTEPFFSEEGSAAGSSIQDRRAAGREVVR